MEIVVAEEILAVEILLIHHIYQMEYPELLATRWLLTG